MLTLLLALLLDETAIRGADIQAHQEVLAADGFEGREAGSEGGHKAALYIVGRLKELGLTAHLQPFGPDRAFLEAGGKSYTLGRGIVPYPLSPRGRVAGTLGSDVVIVDGAPAPSVLAELAAKGAKAVIAVGGRPAPQSALYPLPVLGVVEELGPVLRKAEGPATLEVGLGRVDGPSLKNVYAVVPGSDPEAREYVVVGAHYDHVGLGHRNGNPGAGSTPGQVHNGADDNASGASTLLEVAEAVVKAKLPRTVVLVWFDAEEGGLAGSRAFVADPPLPIADCRAMINMDMIGRNETEKVVIGVHKKADGAPVFPRWASLVGDLEKDLGARWDWKSFDEYIKRSDHWPFMAAGVPAIFFTGGLHADYHTERDDVEKINVAKQEAVGRAVYRLAAAAARAPQGFR